MSTLDFAYAAYGAGGVLAVLSAGAGFYGVLRGTDTRPNYNILSIGAASTVTMMGLGTGLLGYNDYINADKDVRDSKSLFKPVYIQYKQQQAGFLMLGSVGLPIASVVLLNPRRRRLQVTALVGLIIMAGGTLGTIMNSSLGAIAFDKVKNDVP
jgi:hypothetical protein